MPAEEDGRRLKDADEVWDFVQNHLSHAIDKVEGSIDMEALDHDDVIDMDDETLFGANDSDISPDDDDEDDYSVKEVTEIFKEKNSSLKTEKWNPEDKERMANLLEGMTEWINKYASVLDDPEAAIPLVIKKEMSAEITPLSEEQVVEMDESFEPLTIEEEMASESEEEPQVKPLVTEVEAVLPEIHTQGFVVFANSPDTSRFQFASNLKNFGNIQISFSSFNSEHPDQNQSFHKEFRFGGEPAEEQQEILEEVAPIDMRMPDMFARMPPMIDNSMPDMRMPEMQMPDPFGMFHHMDSHFKMMDELMGRIRHRDDWARLQPHEWHTMVPHSVRFLQPQVQVQAPEWDEDFESPVLLQGEQPMFLEEEPAGRHLHGRDYWEEEEDVDTEAIDRIRCTEVLNALGFIICIAAYCAMIRVHCCVLRRVTNLK